jgi:hypothetical protein
VSDLITAFLLVMAGGIVGGAVGCGLTMFIVFRD